MKIFSFIAPDVSSDEGYATVEVIGSSLTAAKKVVNNHLKERGREDLLPVIQLKETRPYIEGDVSYSSVAKR